MKNDVADGYYYIIALLPDALRQNLRRKTGDKLPTLALCDAEHPERVLFVHGFNPSDARQYRLSDPLPDRTGELTAQFLFGQNRVIVQTQENGELITMFHRTTQWSTWDAQYEKYGIDGHA